MLSISKTEERYLRSVLRGSEEIKLNFGRRFTQIFADNGFYPEIQ
jgi:hypothetical protein